jgi:diguanylate cyclase (GGDEF)-like protein
MLKPQVQRTIWLLWLLILPLGMWVIYHFYPPLETVNALDLLGFLLLTAFVASTPMIINNTPIFYIQWVSLAVFLSFGFLIEVIFMQLAIAVLLIRLRVPKEQLYRLPLNWLMFFTVSVVSGLVYYGLGGTHGVDIISNPKNLVLALIYALTAFLVNHFMLTFIGYILTKRKRDWLDQDLIWEAGTTILTLPIGLVLYILYQEVGLISIVFVGIPFATLSIILNLYHSSDKVNQYLQKAGEIGHELAQRLDVEEVLDLYISKLTEMFPVDYAYILDIVDNKELQLLRKVEKEIDPTVEIRPLRKNEGISGHVWNTRKAVLYHSQKEWKGIVQGYMPKKVESIICVPIVRSNDVIAVLLLASEEKRAYEKAQLMIVDILSSYFAVAIENAKHYERTKEDSERCALTKLYNYRYMERRLNEEYNLLTTGIREHLSVILLDIDHFKSVNDTYGHQSGNEILYQLANRLSGLIEEETGTVARYGGEEFLIMLPDIDKKSALNIAEFVRQTIANRPFVLTQHIQDNQKDIAIQITASIGVATAPEDADDAMSLIRHADRALYVGAKRNGRNKVAEYVK